MSVITRSDEDIAEAKVKISEAYKLLNHALDDDTWGSGDYNDGYVKMMEKCVKKLRKMKRKL